MMNERIKELRKQVKVDLNKFHSDPEFYKNHVEPLALIFTQGDNALLNEYMTKFAELIVRECANIVNSLEQYEGPGDCSTAEYIKEHFGVE